MTTRPTITLTPVMAKAFAEAWYAGWNAHDIDAIMACYDESIEHSSPFIKRYNGTDELALRGKPAVREYFARALARVPSLRFTPEHLAVGLESVLLVYRRMTDDLPAPELSAEVFFLNAHAKIVRSVSHYG